MIDNFKSLTEKREPQNSNQIYAKSPLARVKNITHSKLKEEAQALGRIFRSWETKSCWNRRSFSKWARNVGNSSTYWKRLLSTFPFADDFFNEAIRKRGRKNIEIRLGQTFRKCRWDDFRDASVSPPSTSDPLQNFFWCRWLFLRSLSSTSSYPVSNFWPHAHRDLPGSFFQSQILSSYVTPRPI